MVRIGLLSLLLCGCSRSDSILPDPPRQPVPLGTRFDPNGTGSLRGRVTWTGDLPQVPKIQAVTRSQLQGLTVDNPHTPRVDGKSQGLAGAVIFLRGVDPERSRPWDLTPVSVEIAQNQLGIRAGDSAARSVGFVRVGDPVSLNALDSGIQMVRARGTEFFTLPFPVPNQPVTRIFDQPGRVELTNGAGYYWQSADLFICEHPYYTITNTDGSFHLPQVPSGKYELIAWVRDWHIGHTERDPETGLILRQSYRPPVEKHQRITITPGKESASDFSFQKSDFSR